MGKGEVRDVRRKDYSMVGKDAALAVEKGLVEANWYHPPIPKDKLRELLVRRDGPAICDTLLWFALLIFFGVCGYLLWGTAWAIIPFAIYGVLYASVSDSRWHECGHGTPFKTDWMNNALYEVASFMELRESVRYRWSHTRHHSDTLIVGRDPEIAAPVPVKLGRVFLRFFDVNTFRVHWHDVFLHSMGRLTPDERTYIPETEFGKLFVRARIYILIYAGVIALAIATRSILPLMYIGLPTFYGSWWMVLYGFTQHASLAENVLDHRLNTRTVYMDPISRFLCWNMGYHLEHHLFPTVPYHALPKLHQLIKAYTPAPYQSILDAYREILPAMIRQSKDATYFVRRQLPPPASLPPAPESVQTVIAEGKALADGWIEVCDSRLLAVEDVLRFDREQKTYAIYRAADGKPYASDGLCTHGNAHLADGFVKGTIIECAKHNGRFDIRDGSPQRLPVCVGLKTYPVREANGKLQVDLRSAGGYGVTQAAVTHTFRVVSNLNVGTFIKELVLEPAAGSVLPDYQPGEYLQMDIPAFPERTLGDIEVGEAYTAAWQSQKAFDYRAANPTPCRRNYSMATNPALDRNLAFNVRLAAPPRGVDCYAGVGSTYLFGLKPGDTVTAIGPFGKFHVKDTAAEMIYLGGGAGMAPLRSHLSWLLETRRTTARISYWYGARSRQELFYQEYFEDLARRFPNFSFHVALSEPRPEDQWQSYTGFIHEVLQRQYLAAHPDPQSIEYFLCGPPAMIQAAVTMLKNLGVPPTQVNYDEF